MGKAKRKLVKRKESQSSCSAVQTVAGRVQVRWEAESAATPMGQLAYFIEFLTLSGLWSRWIESCPLAYTSPNAPGKGEVLGTWMLSILSGHRRYAHVTGIRCDGVNPALLGMGKVISEDALRSALKHIAQSGGSAWLSNTSRRVWRPCSMRHGFWISTPRSSRSTVTSKARYRATTRESRGAPHTLITPT
jgi:hypothetical protein